MFSIDEKKLFFSQKDFSWLSRSVKKMRPTQFLTQLNTGYDIGFDPMPVGVDVGNIPADTKIVARY
jgi:hypothetical protein